MLNSKSYIIGILALFLVFPVAFAKTYSDVPATHKNYDAINYLTETKTVEGYPNGEFQPDGLINRAEVVAVMTREKFPPVSIETALDLHKKAGHSYVIFPDVPISEWFGKYVQVSYQNNVIQGYPDGFFRPGNKMNFAEALKVILETYKVDFSQNKYQFNKLLLVNQGDWFEKYFTYAEDHNLLNQNKFYHPGQLITRGEFVEIIYRLETMLKARLPEYVADKFEESDEYTITIPKLNIVNVNVNFANIYDSSSALSILKYGLGNYLNPPDAGKKTLLFGHSSGYSWDHSSYKTILKEINKLNNGDRIYINYKEKGYVFEVFRSEIIPASQDYKLVENEDADELAMYTCWPPNSIAQRYVVYGKPV